MTQAKIDYIELPGSDIPATKRFYSSVFGWTFTDYGPDYVAFEAQKVGGGFSTERRVAQKAGPLVIFYTEDLAGMEEKIRSAGAEVFGHLEFTGGRRFHFLDPNGNELAVWTDK
jgi:predicted enzyme related to lactoylglutathione lyase